MTPTNSDHELGAADVAEILDNTATVLSDFQASNTALQDVLLSLGQPKDLAPHLLELQHIDRLTQTHADLAQLLRVLASWARGDTVRRSNALDAVTLHSLQDALIHATPQAKSTSSGDVALF